MKTHITFDELFDASKDAESLELEQLCFDVSHQFGDRLAELARERGMSQRQLAKALGVSEVYVSRVLHGQPNLTLATIVKFARALESRVIPPRIVRREAGRGTLLIEAEVSKNASRPWGSPSAETALDRLRRPVTSSKKAGNDNVPSTAA
jgi:transcriptional regulator with XRE-family HTH domain